MPATMPAASRLLMTLLALHSLVGFASADALHRPRRRAFTKVHQPRSPDAIQALQWSSNKERALASHGALAPRAGPSALPSVNAPDGPLVPACTLGQSLVGATCVPCVDQSLVPGLTAGTCLPPSMNLAVTPGTVNVFTYAVDNLPAGGTFRVVVTDSSPSARLGKRAGHVVYDTGAQPVVNTKNKGSFSHTSSPTTQVTVTVTSEPSGASIESFTSTPAPTCPAGSTYSTSTTTCEVTDPAAAANCATGTVYDPVDKTCKPVTAPVTCPTGPTVSGSSCSCTVGTYNTATKICDPAPTPCPPGSTYSAATNLCTPDLVAPLTCAAGSMPNAAANACSTCASLLRNAGTTDGTCGGCIAAFATLSSEGTCPCDAGYVLNSVTKACDSCAALGRIAGAGTCGPCVDNTKTIGTGGICVTPPLACTIANQVVIAGVCTCDVGFILVGSSCATCASLGKVSGTTANACSTCSDPLASASSPTSVCAIPALVCPPGKAPNAGGTACDICPVNTFSLTGASCATCPVGTIAPAGSILASACLGCPVGSYLNAGLCSLCDANTFSASAGATACDVCPTGSISAAGAIACTPCPAGSYLASGVCAPCAVDTFSDAAGATVCQACPAGSSALLGAVSCTSCPAGSAIVGGVCSPCAAGTFSAAGGSLSCDLCAAGTSSLAGATICAPCTGNTASAPGGLCNECVGRLTNAEHTLCRSCPSGSVLSGGTCVCSNQRVYTAETNTCAPCASVNLPNPTGLSTGCGMPCSVFSTLSNGACTCSNGRAYITAQATCAPCSTVNLPDGPSIASCLLACLPNSTLSNGRCTCSPQLGFTYWPAEIGGPGCREILKNPGFENDDAFWNIIQPLQFSTSLKKSGTKSLVLRYNGGETFACQTVLLDGKNPAVPSGLTTIAAWSTWTGTRPTAAYFKLKRLSDRNWSTMDYPSSATFTDAAQGTFKLNAQTITDVTGVTPGMQAMYELCLFATVPNAQSFVYFDEVSIQQTALMPP